MQFRFLRFQHVLAGRMSLDDLIAVIGGQLVALGHAVEIDDDKLPSEGGAENFFRTDPGTVNIVFEAFHAPEVLAALQGAAAAGAKIVCVATEQPGVDADGAAAFNHGLTYKAAERCQAFAAAAEYLHAIWHLVPGDAVNAFYAGFGKPAVYLDLGHAPGLREMIDDPGDRPAKKYAFGFYGSLTPRRRQMLETLALQSKEKIRILGATPDGLAPWAVRNQAMRECEVGLQLRAYDEAELVSSSRCAMFLHMGLPVVGDRHALDVPWGGIVDLAGEDGRFVALAMDVLQRRRETYTDQWARFAARLTPQACAGAALAATLAGAHRPVWRVPSRMAGLLAAFDEHATARAIPAAPVVTA